MPRIMRNVFACLVVTLLAVVLYAPHPVRAQTSYVRTIIAPNQADVPLVEERGMIRITANGKDYEKRYVLRYPETDSQWNQKLLIGAHGGSGGVLYYRNGWIMGTDETALDDVIAAYALDGGYAYASVDRNGIGGTREGLALTYAFTRLIRERVQEIYGRQASYVYLAGLSAGGAITRYAAEDPDPQYDGVVIIAGGGGGTSPQLERQAKLVTLWPEVAPSKYPDRPLTHASVKAYASAIGTPVEARPFWPFVGAGHSLDGFRQTLERYGLTGLTDKQLKNFRMKHHRKNTTFMDNVARAQATSATGRVTIPTIEVVGTYDDIVIAGVLAYKEQVKKVSKKASRPTPADRHRLYQVAGVWHISTDDDAIYSFQYIMGRMGLSEEAQDRLEKGDTYIPTVHEALGYLDQWVTAQTPPPSDQTVQPGEKLKQ